MAKDIEFRYFRCVEGYVVPRYGTATCIGVKRTKGGWVWDEEDIARIPKAEVARYNKEYQRALRTGALVEVKASDFEKPAVASKPTKPKPEKAKPKPEKKTKSRGRKKPADSQEE